MQSWFEKTETSLSSSLKNYYRCLIFGENFSDHHLPEKFGYNNEDNTVRLLKPNEFLKRYNYTRDPESFSVLFESEATDIEKELIEIDRENTLYNFINRVTLVTRLEIFPIFTRPDPFLHAVLLIPNNPFVFKESDRNNTSEPVFWSDPAILCKKDQKYFGNKRPSLKKYIEAEDELFRPF